MSGGPENETGETVQRRARRRRLKETYDDAANQQEGGPSGDAMKVLSSVNELGILIDAAFSWLEKEVRNLSKLGFDTGPHENDLKRLEQEFDQNNHLNAIGISEQLSETIRNNHLDYFQNGSSMILSSMKRRFMEYEGIGINITPGRSLLQDAIEDMQKNEWAAAWEKTRKINLVFSIIEKSIEEGTEEELDLAAALDSIGDMTWEIDDYMEKIQALMKIIPIDDTDKTLAVLANIKSRIMDAKSKGLDVASAIETFKKSEPEIREADNLKALVWAKLANDELLLLEDE